MWNVLKGLDVKLVMLCVLIGLLHPARSQTTSPRASDPDLSVAALLSDPATPTGGNPQGDVTIVEFFDYNCPYCTTVQPEFLKLLVADQKIRVVYKDWPIFGAASTFAAKVALAAGWQGKYVAVHNALLNFGRRNVSNDRVLGVAAEVGVDLARLDADMVAHESEISVVLTRTAKQATTMGFTGTPVFLVGPFLIQGAVDEGDFEKAVSDARKRKEQER